MHTGAWVESAACSATANEKKQPNRQIIFGLILSHANIFYSLAMQSVECAAVAFRNLLRAEMHSANIPQENYVVP